MYGIVFVLDTVLGMVVYVGWVYSDRMAKTYQRVAILSHSLCL